MKIETTSAAFSSPTVRFPNTSKAGERKAFGLLLLFLQKSGRSHGDRPGKREHYVPVYPPSFHPFLSFPLSPKQINPLTLPFEKGREGCMIILMRFRGRKERPPPPPSSLDDLACCIRPLRVKHWPIQSLATKAFFPFFLFGSLQNSQSTGTA